MSEKTKLRKNILPGATTIYTNQPSSNIFPC